MHRNCMRKAQGHFDITELVAQPERIKPTFLYISRQAISEDTPYSLDDSDFESFALAVRRF